MNKSSHPLTHPFHLIHPLTLFFLDPDDDNKYDASIFIDVGNNRSDDTHTSDDNNSSLSEADDDDASLSEHGDYEKCNCCQSRRTEFYYYCSTCNFTLNFPCVNKLPPLTITHLKSHDHTLTLLPRRLLSPCDACGFSLETVSDFVYNCLHCNYMVHRKCIYLPRVIKITRHFHRLSFCPSRSSSGRFSCGVCRKPVDMNHGQYSCNQGCEYAVHSKCATRDDVWDGKDLEGVPEEEDEDGNVESFVRIDEETIHHFSHDQHNLRFYLKMNHRDDNKYCEACCLPMTVSDSFYSCMQCEFALHQACACLPRKKYHPLHKHPLTLDPFPFEETTNLVVYGGIFNCNGCDRVSSGFQYKCNEEGCKFKLDTMCSSLSDPLIHDIHPHGLFFNLTRGKCKGFIDSSSCSTVVLECRECKFFLCLYCATLPCVAHYEHDKHPLVLCYGEKEKSNFQYWFTKKQKNLQYWCEICESKLDKETWFYTCGSCCVTLHVACLVKRNMLLKPNHTVKIKDEDAEMVSNNGNSRPLCHYCGLHCSSSFILKRLDRHYCDFSCMKRRPL